MRRWVSDSALALTETLSSHPKMGLVAWALGVAVLLVLLMVRIASGAEFAFASLALLPVVWSAWTNGRAAGGLMALLASAMWIAGDLVSDREFALPWVPWLNGVIHAAMYLLVVTLAAELRELLQREHQRAIRDDLTGLLNRRRFMEAGSIEVARAIRHGHALTMLFMDLDNFKQLNDGRGHDAGDEALRALAGALRQSARATDVVARLGGDEFVVLLTDGDDLGGRGAARRLAHAANAALGRFPKLSVSVGAARFAWPPPSLSEMLRATDMLMYRAKRAGPGTLVFEDFAAAETR